MIGDRVPTPFDGQKVAYHLRYWEQMEQGRIPPPVLVTLDPINRCNLRCTWCNAAAQMKDSQDCYSDETVAAMGSFLADWGVKAVCIAGGGEPLLHSGVSDLIGTLVDSGIEVGVVTNGTLIHKHVEALGRCRWVGVSVDAGTAKGFTRHKGVDLFSTVIKNLYLLRNAWPNLEIAYKYLIAPDNITEIVPAAHLAADAHCTYFHARPVGLTWSHIQDSMQRLVFRHGEIVEAVDSIKRARELYGDCLDIHATTDKFSSAWTIKHRFDKCRAMGMTCVISPNGTAGLCCDRRGDPKTELCSWGRLEDVREAWSSAKHWQIMNDVSLDDCPRCTYAPHNELYKAFIEQDLTCKNFI